MELTAEERMAAWFLDLTAAGHENAANADPDLDEEQVRIRVAAAAELRQAAEAIRRGEHRTTE